MDDKSAKNSALIVACASSFTTPFMISAVNIGLPAIEKEFQTDAVLLSWVATSYLLAAAVSMLPSGKLADIYGRKRIYLLGIFVFTISSLLSAISTSAPMLIFFRVFQGAGSAMIFATGIAILTSVFPPHERGRVLGIAVAAVYAGLSCGPFFGGWLTHLLGWRSLFLVNIPLGVVIIVLVLWKLKGEWIGAAGESFDLAGSVVYGIGVIAIMYGISRLPAVFSILLILIGLAAFAVFVKLETRVEHPVFEVDLFITNRVFAFSCLAALIHYSATFAVAFLLSFYLQYLKGLSPQGAGMVLIAQPIMMALFSPLAGKLSDRIEPRVIASSGMAITALGLMFLIWIHKGTGLGFVVASLMILGFGFALFSSPNMNAIMSAVDKRFYGIASGSVGTMRLLGQMFSMAIATLIFALFIGRAHITEAYFPALLKSVRLGFIVFAGLCVIGIFFSLSRGQLRPASGRD